MCEKAYPDVYLLTKFPGLETELRKCLPDVCNLIKVPAEAPLKTWSEGIHLSKEEMNFFKDAEVLVCDSTYLRHILYKLPNIKWVQTTWAGVDMLMEEFDKTQPIPAYITTRYTDSYFGDLMSNYVIAQIINIERGFYIYRDKQKESQWSRPFFPDFRVLSDLTVGVLGAGTLGTAVGRLLKKCGCHVIILVRTKRDSLSDDYDESTTNLNEVLERSDYICNVLPSTESTRGLLSGNAFQNCKKKPVFINIGRADIIEELTVIKALKEGWISKAILDVFETEPLPPDSALWKTDEVYITPHMAGIPKIAGIAQFISENYMRYVNKEALANVVDWEKGY